MIRLKPKDPTGSDPVQLNPIEPGPGLTHSRTLSSSSSSSSYFTSVLEKDVIVVAGIVIRQGM